MSNLCQHLPTEWSQADFSHEWDECLQTLRFLGEEGVSCAQGIGTRQRIFHELRSMGTVRDILDIGTFVGTSALLFALAAPKARVVTVDMHEQNFDWGLDFPYHLQKPFWVTEKRRQSPRDLMIQAGVEDRVEFVRDDSVRYMQKTSRRFDFISIDGWHEHFQVAREVPLAISLLKPGGLIFLDDVQIPGYAPPPGIDRIPGPYQGLQIAATMNPGLFKIHYINRNYDGTPNAVAFLTAAE